MESGRSATRNFKRSAAWARAAQVIHGSSLKVPAGVRIESNPVCSAARAIWVR